MPSVALRSSFYFTPSHPSALLKTIQYTTSLQFYDNINNIWRFALMAMILIVEDELAINELLRRNLTLVGHDCVQAFSGEEALERIVQTGFDLVLLDEMMPGLDGLSTLEQLKLRDPNVPVIMITKNEEEHLMNEAIGRRIDDYLTKPVNPSQIFMACKKILDARQIRQSQAGQTYVTRAQQISDWLSGDITWRTWRTNSAGHCFRKIPLYGWKYYW